jgi:hypothetical protein
MRLALARRALIPLLMALGATAVVSVAAGQSSDRRDFCSRLSKRNCATLVLGAQKVRSATSFGLNVHLESAKQPLAIAVVFPEGSAYPRRGAACSPEQAPDCPKEARLGGGLAWWHIENPDISFDCDAANETAVRVFNASSVRGYVVRMRFLPGCVICPVGLCTALLDSRFRQNELTITLPDFEKEWEQQVPDLPPVQATMSHFSLSARGKTKAGVPLLRTPRVCNRERGWKSVVKVLFDDGSTMRFKGRHPCHR